MRIVRVLAYCVLYFGAALLFAAAALQIYAQQQFARGQDVAPTFEGWEQNADGNFSMVFGYLNRNFQEELDIPVGPNNAIEPGGDRGQPTHFYPRRQRFVFKVAVPKDWPKDRKVTWTLVSRGKTNTAKGWLQAEWELNDGVVAENNGGGVLSPGNKAPSIAGPSSLTVALPNPAVLTVTAVDDGLPKPGPRPLSSTTDPDTAARVQKAGVSIKWSIYRAAGPVEFDPESAPAEYGAPVVLRSRVGFGAPGAYILRATASDNQLFSYHDVTVTVTGTAPTAK
jgi:hypothetical protein